MPNCDDFYEDPDSVWGSWELDFDGDGLMELVYLIAGGTMGNEYWDIIHLDTGGLISSVDFYALIDIDNDGTDETVGEWIYLPSSAHQWFMQSLRAQYDGAPHTFDFSRLLCGDDYHQRIFPISYEGKNYFLTMQPFGDSQYIFRLQEISCGTPYVLAAWVATTEDQVIVTTEEYENWW